MKPYIINRIEEGIKCGKSAFILEFNTNDRQFFLEEEIFPTSLHLALATYLGKQGYHTGLYSQGLGLQQLNTPNSAAGGANPFSNSNTQSLSSLTPILRRCNQKSALIVQYSDLLAPLSEGNAFLEREQQITLETLHRWGSDDAIKQSQNIVLLISYEGGVNSLLSRSGVYTVIQVPLPDIQMRQEFIEFMDNIKANNKKKFASLEDGFTIEEMVRNSNGLRLNDIESLFRSKIDSCISRKDVQSAKAKSINELAGGLVEVVNSDEGFESIAGLPNVKEYFTNLKWMFQNGSPAMPYAMILAGVPGTGKSMLCGTLAKELDIPLLILRNLHGPFVGQSEANLERVLRIVDSMSPCIIVIEEIDQSIGKRNTSGTSGDSGTTDRMSQRFWEALGSNKNRGKNLWIGTSNKPDILDTAMLDRFQVIIPFLHPTPSEVKELIPLLVKQINRELKVDVNLDEIACSSNLYLPTVRGLNEIITAAATRADIQNSKINSPISKENLMLATKDYKLTYDVLQHEYIALKTIEMVPFASLLPWMSLNGRRPNFEIPSYLSDLVNEEGYIIQEKLYKKLHNIENEISYKKYSK